MSAKIVKIHNAYFMVYFAADGESIAVGNGYSSTTSVDDAFARNGYAHTYESAQIVANVGGYPSWLSNETGAEFVGDFKEWTNTDADTTPGINTRDEYKDQYNNELGRRIGSWLNDWIAEQNSQGHYYSDQQKQDFLDDLIRDADLSNDMIKYDATDPRSSGFNNDPSLYQDPQGDVTWIEPSNEWIGKSADRDYSQSDEFLENPFAVLLLPAYWELQVLDYLVGRPLYDSLKNLADAMEWAKEHPTELLNILVNDSIGDILLKLGQVVAQGPQGDRVTRSHDPLVFDLDGDGYIELTDSVNSSVYFDFNNDGFANLTGWVSADDGMFAIDLDGNGTIDNVSELFGSQHPLAYVTQSFTKTLGSESGFANLAAYDTNGNGVIDVSDAQWGDIRIWQDVNQDGVSQSTELLTLDQVGIATIDITTYSLARNQFGLFDAIEGNTISHHGFATMTDTSQRSVYDVWLAAGNETVNIRDIELKLETYFLPNLKGFGTVMNLNYEASDSDDLLQSLTTFAQNHTDFASDLANLAQVKQEVADLVLQWARIDTNNPVANYLTRGVYSELPGYEFIQKLSGRDITADGPWFQDSPFMPGTVDGVSAILESWDSLINAYTARLLLQTSAAELFEEGLAYNPYNDTFVGVANLSETAISALAAEIATGSDPYAAWKDVATFITTIKSLSSLTTDEVSWLDSAIQSSTSNAYDWQDIVETLSVTTIQHLADSNETAPYADQTLHGTNGEDHIFAGNGRYDDYSSDTLYGYDGNDFLSGGYGNDILVGGAGNDRMAGGYGDDIYVYDSGTDFIVEDANTGKTATDTIAFGAGISQSDVSIDYAFNGGRAGIPVSQNYVIQVEGRGSIIVENITGGFTPLYIGQIIDQLTFDGITNPVSINDVAIRFWGTDESDNISLSNWDSSHSGPVSVYAGAGNDNIGGFSDADHLFDLGTGDDTVSGGMGDDVYVVSAGIKMISDRGGSDTVILPEGVTQGDLEFHKVALDGYRYRDIEIIAGDTTIYIPGAFDVDPATGNVAIETIQFSDNTTLNLASQQFEIIGSEGNDQFATPYYGAWSNDVYVFGHGDDVISDSGGADKIRFEDGVTLNDLTIERIDGIVPNAGWIGAHLMISDANGNSMIIANAFDATNTTQNILTGFAVETLLFSDNTTVDVSSLTIGQGTNSNGGTHDQGSSSDDTISGTSNADVLSGGAGNDTIHGDEGNDTLFGGTGSDHLYGGLGNDTYYYYSGDGADEFHDLLDQGYDTLVFADLSLGDLNIWTDESSKLFHISSKLNSSDQITFSQDTGFYRNDVIIQDYLERIVFADGLSFELKNGLYLTGTQSANDTLIGNNGNDVITSQAGNDKMSGGLGDDTYIFNLGDGQDTITEGVQAGFDVIRFGVGITPDMVRIIAPSVNNPSDTAFTFAIEGTSDTLTVFGADETSENASLLAPIGNRTIEQVVFEDGTVWDLTSGLRMTGDASEETFLGTLDSDAISGLGGIDHLYGYDGDDRISGGAGDDVISGGAGNDIIQGDEGDDTLSGGSGDDTFIYAPNMGADIINEDVDQGNDTLLLAGGMRPETIRIWSDQDGHLYIVNKFNSTEVVKISALIKDNISALGGDFGERLESITFETGEKIDLTGGIYSEGSLNDIYTPQSLFGSGFNDTILGMGGNDGLSGLDGNDILYGDDGKFDDINDGDDTLNGGGGEDILYGEGGNDTLSGGEGNDILIGGHGNDTLYSEAGDDTYVYTLGDGADIILNGSNAGFNSIQIQDVSSEDIYFYVYNSLGYVKLGSAIYGQFYDIQASNEGPNYYTVESTYGSLVGQIIFSDTVWNTSGSATFYGTSDADIMYATKYGDTFYAGGGDDGITGATGNDIIFGESGNDQIYAGGGDDTLVGGTGNDTLYGEAGTDTFVFAVGDGQDTIYDFNRAQSDKIDLSSIAGIYEYNDLNIQVVSSNSIITLNGSDTVTVNGVDDLQGSDFIFAPVPDVIGTSGDDVLVGTHYSETIQGLEGNDIIEGLAGDDILNGGAGADKFVFGDGFGNDMILDFVGGIDRIDLSQLTGIVDFSDVSSSQNGNDTILTFTGISYTITLHDYLAVVSNSDFIFAPVYGTSGNDWLYGTDGDDFIYGLGGSDHLYGYAGNDHLEGGTEQDWVEGGLGNDFVFGNAGDDIISGQEGDDELHGGTGLDYLWGNEGNDTLYGEEDADALRGLEGDDILWGGDGNDNLKGDDVDSVSSFTDAGNDTLYGEAGNDNLAGGAGDDILVGGTGQDTMNGDAGSDTFLYLSGDIDGSRDYIYGFEAGMGGDNINLADVLQYDSLTDTLSDFVFLVQGGSYTRINIDIDGTGTNYGVQAVAQLQNVTGLNLTDMVNNGNLVVE